MYLLLGSPQDSCCMAVHAALKARGYPAHIISNPLAEPARLAWQLSNDESTSQFTWSGDSPVADKDISGVLVRRSGWIDADGWQTDDLAYMQAKMQAALKAEKVEVDAVFEPARVPGPDPRFEQLIEAVAGLTKQVSQLSNQVEELKKKG